MMMSNLLAAMDLGDFISSWYGTLFFVIFDIAVIVFVLTVFYKWFFKYLIDFIFGVSLSIMTLPITIAVAIAIKVLAIRDGEYGKIFASEYIAGKNGKIVKLHSYATFDPQTGELTTVGKILRKFGIENIPRFYDLLILRMSLIGVEPLCMTDEKFISESDYDRFNARPGFINPLNVYEKEDDGEITYEDMFYSDIRYAKNISIYRDLKIVFAELIHEIRGEEEEELFGVIHRMSYSEVLLERGEIAREDYEEARAEEERTYGINYAVLDKIYAMELEEDDEDAEEEDGDKTPEPDENCDYIYEPDPDYAADPDQEIEYEKERRIEIDEDFLR